MLENVLNPVCRSFQKIVVCISSRMSKYRSHIHLFGAEPSRAETTVSSRQGEQITVASFSKQRTNVSRKDTCLAARISVIVRFLLLLRWHPLLVSHIRDVCAVELRHNYRTANVLALPD